MALPVAPGIPAVGGISRKIRLTQKGPRGEEIILPRGGVLASSATRCKRRHRRLSPAPGLTAELTAKPVDDSGFR
jgi:hypothetical protein